MSGTEQDYANLVDRIRANDAAAVTELYQLVQRGVRFLIARSIEYADIEDVLHDVFLAAMKAIHDETIKSPDLLLAYLRGIARNKVAWLIKTRRRSPQAADYRDESMVTKGSPDEQIEHRQRVNIMKRILATMSAADREVLVRFYLKGECPTTICQSMGLTATQFRLLKWRAKARCIASCKRLLSIRRRRPEMPATS